MKFIYLTVFIVLFSGIAFASSHYIPEFTNANSPHFVSVYNIGETSLLPPEEVVVDYSMRNKYDVLYHISEGYTPLENCGVRILKSGFSNSDMEFYGRECIKFEPVEKKNRVFDVQLIYENNEMNIFE